MKKFWYAARFWVFLFAFIVAVSLVFQSLPFITSQLFGIELNANFKLPIDVIGWSWMALVSTYVGSDRLEKIISTKEIPYGQVFMGDLPKLRRIIVLCLVIFFEALALSMIFDVDFGLESFFMAFAASIILYVSANNVIQSMGNVDGSHAVDETLDENQIMDANETDKKIDLKKN